MSWIANNHNYAYISISDSVPIRHKTDALYVWTKRLFTVGSCYLTSVWL